MQRLLLFIVIFFSVILLNSCSKKHHPSRSTATTEKSSPDLKKAEDAVVVSKESKRKASFPKVITVNDTAARKSVDGRLYYDVMGHRYWRNNKDGKYYLFNKSMYNNPDFQKQQ